VGPEARLGTFTIILLLLLLSSLFFLSFFLGKREMKKTHVDVQQAKDDKGEVDVEVIGLVND
jgi:hypothetical protein